MALLDHDGEPEPFVSGYALAPERRRREHEHDPPRLRAVPIAVELDCLRGHVAIPTLQAATKRSRKLGLCADRVLIDWGVVDEATYLGRLARHLGIRVARLDHNDHRRCLFSPAQSAQIVTLGMFPIRREGGVRFVSPRTACRRGCCVSLLSRGHN